MSTRTPGTPRSPCSAACSTTVTGSWRSAIRSSPSTAGAGPAPATSTATPRRSGASTADRRRRSPCRRAGATTAPSCTRPTRWRPSCAPPTPSRCRSQPGRRAADGDVVAARLATVVDEAAWVAEQVRAAWLAAGAAQPDRERTAAVLVRRRAQIPMLAGALRAAGLPVEIVGLGGLLTTPEVADVVATLHVLADYSSGPALLRLLTGSRWRIGPRDLVALSRRARIWPTPRWSGWPRTVRRSRPAPARRPQGARTVPAGPGSRAARSGQHRGSARRPGRPRSLLAARAACGWPGSGWNCVGCVAGSARPCPTWWPRWNARSGSTSRWPRAPIVAPPGASTSTGSWTRPRRSPPNPTRPRSVRSWPTSPRPKRRRTGSRPARSRSSPNASRS